MPEQLILRRRLGKRTSDEKIEVQVDYIIGRGLKGIVGPDGKYRSTDTRPAGTATGGSFVLT